MTRSTQATRVMLVVLVVLGTAYRALLLLEVEPIARGDGAIRYLPMAHNLLSGRGFTTAASAPFVPTSHEVPGYPLLLAGILGASQGSLRAVVACQLLLEVSTLFLASRMALALGLSRFAAGAALSLGMGCLFLPSMAFEIQAATFGTFVMTAFCYLALRILRSEAINPWSWGMAGIAGGVSSMVRVDTYVLLALVSPLLGWRLLKAPRGQRLVSAGAFVIGCFAMLVPWMARDWATWGRIQLPGQQQFTYSHMGHGIKNWMDTWADDGRYLEMYVWGPWGSRPSEFPSQAVPDPIERARAGSLFRLAKTEGVDPLTPEVDHGFRELAADARSRRPLRSTLVVGLTRVVTLWPRMPIGTMFPWGYRNWVMVWQYGLWFTILALALLGARGLGTGPASLLPIALILTRSAIPLASPWGLATIYLIQGVPAVLVLAGCGLSRLFNGEPTRCA